MRGRRRVLRQWAGICDMTPDFSPIIGTVPDVAGFILDVGWGTYGFKAGPVAGRRVAELIATGRTAGGARPVRDRTVRDRHRSSARRRPRRSRTRTAAGKREEGAHGRATRWTTRRPSRETIARRLADDGVDLHACPVGGHPRHAALQGRAGQRARPVPRAGAPGSPARPPWAWARGRTSHDLIGMPDLDTYTRRALGDRASPGSPATSGGRRAVAVLLADGPAPRDRAAGRRRATR